MTHVDVAIKHLPKCGSSTSTCQFRGGRLDTYQIQVLLVIDDTVMVEEGLRYITALPRSNKRAQAVSSQHYGDQQEAH